MLMRTATLILALWATTASSARCEDEADPRTVLETEATEGLPDSMKPSAPLIPKPVPDDSELADSIDSGHEGG